MPRAVCFSISRNAAGRIVFCSGLARNHENESGRTPTLFDFTHKEGTLSQTMMEGKQGGEMAESEIVWFKLTVENPKEPESISDLIKQFLRFYYTTNLRRGVALSRTGK